VVLQAQVQPPVPSLQVVVVAAAAAVVVVVVVVAAVAADRLRSDRCRWTRARASSGA
jgi:hypothetical protein